MNNLPFGISVVIPTFNRREPLIRAIESVSTSMADRVEIIVVDDGSKEDPRDFLPTRNRYNVSVRCFRFERNRGVQSARNLGVRRSRFAFVAFLDSDDEFLPAKIDSAIDVLEAGNIDLLFHGTAGMSRYGRLARIWQTHLAFIPFTWLASIYNPVVTPALIVRRGNRLGPPSLRHCEDYAFLLHYCSHRTRVFFLDRELTRVHRAQGAAGGLSAARWQMRRGEFAARRVLLREPGVGAWLRFTLGSCAGATRIVADLVRGRYRARPLSADAS